MTKYNSSKQQPDKDKDKNHQHKDEQNKKSKARRRWIILIVLAVIIIGALVFGLPYYLYAISHVSTDDAFIEAHISPVSARVAGHVWKIYVNDNELVKQGDLLVELDPRDRQISQVRASAKLDQTVADVLSGKINVALTEIIANAALSEAKASVILAQAKIESSKATVAVAKSQHEQALSDLTIAQRVQQQLEAQAEAAVPIAELDQADLKRSQQMYESNSITPQQLDHARATAEVSKANLDAARKQVDVAKARTALAQIAVKTAEQNIRRAEAELSQAEASLQQAKAQLESAQSAPQKVELSNSQLKVYESQSTQARQELLQAQLDLLYTKIYAPISGRVTHKTAQLGSYVIPGQMLMSVVPQNIYITANYKETDLANMESGQPVAISIDAYPGAEFHGHVVSIQAGSGAVFSLLPPENASGNYIKVVQRIPVKIVFDPLPDQNEYYIVPGMSVIPEVDISHRNLQPSAEKHKPPYIAWRRPFDSNSIEQPTAIYDSNSADNGHKK